MSDEAGPTRMRAATTWEQVVETTFLPLCLLGRLPPTRVQLPEAPAPTGTVPAWWGTCQHMLLTNLWVTWSDAFRQHDWYETVLQGWFVPPVDSLGAAQVWTHTLATCTALLTVRAPCHPATLEALTYVVTRLEASTVFSASLQACQDEPHAARRDIQWAEAAAQMSALPTRVANVYGPQGASAASVLDPYKAWVPLLAVAMVQHLDESNAELIAVLLARLARAGHVTPAFWEAAAPYVLQQSGEAWERIWHGMEERVCETMLLALLHMWQERMECTPYAYPVAKDERAPGTEGRAFLTTDAMRYAYSAYRMLVLVAGAADAPRWSWARLGTATDTATYAPLLCVSVAAWAMEADGIESLAALLRGWSDVRRITRASLAQEEGITTLVLVALRYVRDAPEAVRTHATSPAILRGVAAHMEHHHPAFRRLGMLVAEVLSAASGVERPLRFPDTVWEGRGDGRETCRVLRALYDRDGPLWPSQDVICWEMEKRSTTPPPRAPAPIRKSPVTVALPRRVPPRPLVVDLESEASAPPLPAMHALALDDESDDEVYDEVYDEGDTSLMLDAALRKKAKVPVYIYELVPLLRERDYTANRLALKHAETLIRRKTGWGNEIAEHAVDVAVALASLQDTYDLCAFEERRTRALSALCIAAPGPVVDCLYEQVFSPHYALAQRLSMLRAVAMAAQEMAGLPVVEAVAASRQGAAWATERARAYGSEQLTQDARTRPREVVQSTRIAAPTAPWQVRPTVPFTQAAAQAFLFPLVRRCEAALQHGSRTYAGSDATTSPPVLAAVLHTLCVLCQAGRNAPFFATRIAPDVLLFAERLSSHKDTSVVEAAFALILVVLDAVSEAGSAHLLAREQAPLLVRLQSVAASQLAGHDTVESSAAAVVLRISEMQEQVRQALLSL
ncbi:telomere binding protein [Malassezia nana]|uniref:Telomere binding protein n=1 Tax=Malassezia nana TaxID=180528 RepID=A0AAF0J417_9BASI|nr:telomere binding protein [Malassezia nana]